MCFERLKKKSIKPTLRRSSVILTTNHRALHNLPLITNVNSATCFLLCIAQSNTAMCFLLCIAQSNTAMCFLLCIAQSNTAMYFLLCNLLHRKKKPKIQHVLSLGALTGPSNKHALGARMEILKEKSISESIVNNQRIGITLKLEAIKKNFVSSRSKKGFTDVLCSLYL